MNPLKNGVRVTNAQFINEYQLLGVVSGGLVLFSGGGNRAAFELASGINATDIQRTYELDDTTPFRVNPEEGIVVVTVQGYSEGLSALVVPTKVFARFKLPKRPTGFVANLMVPTTTVRWGEWGRFVVKLKLLPVTPFNVFHTHIHCLEHHTKTFRVSDPNSGGTKRRVIEFSVGSRVFDFSLYSRKWVADNRPNHVPAETDYKSCDVADSTYDRDQLRPLAVTLCDGVTTRYHKDNPPIPTENGLLIIKVRIPVHVAKYIRILT